MYAKMITEYLKGSNKKGPEFSENFSGNTEVRLLEKNAIELPTKLAAIYKEEDNAKKLSSGVDSSEFDPTNLNSCTQMFLNPNSPKSFTDYENFQRCLLASAKKHPAKKIEIGRAHV